ncbi:lycopene beta-cyclase CrtY [uncultured Sphingomonas sp.]|uniref:lycopene beta-cyclase CrtY n=1 Tax=uncultured Sphingomonas sp. TaxID=158754 RepID=UPI0035CC2EF0
MGSTITCDVAIVGGGLAGGLIALALKARHPALDVRLIDAARVVGGNHRWSFFDSDVSESDRWIVAPLIGNSWMGYDVAFPEHRRSIDTVYHSIDSERLDAVVRRTLTPSALMLSRAVTEISPTMVSFADGDRLQANGVIDARGAGDLSMLDLGWQKFVGRELRLSAPHGSDRPMVMDATVDQIDGYRFVYCLPLAPDRMFVEDTYYSDHPALDRATIGDRVHEYAVDRGWQVEQAAREEAGVLPVVMGGDFAAYWQSGGPGIAKVGMRAGLFHPTTGYSLPDAVRTAALIAARTDFTGASLHEATYGFAREKWRQRGFFRMLDTMLFKAAEPADRYRILERFYRLDPSLIGRFYAGTSTMIDKARVLTGKPPVPIGRAVRALAGRS